MREDRVSTIIQKVYAKKYNLAPSYEMVPGSRPYLSRLQPLIGAIQRKRFRILAVVLTAVLATATVYYFNTLVSAEQDVLTFMSGVTVLEQRRNDISVNLSRAVLDYSKYERSVLTSVVSLRSLLSEKGVKSPEIEELIKEYKLPEMPAPGKGADKLAGMPSSSALNRLLAIAEQYPDLKLATNFQTLMTALVEVERDLAAARLKYNDYANIYTTILARFPEKYFALIFGFKTVPYFDPAEGERRFKPIDY